MNSENEVQTDAGHIERALDQLESELYREGGHENVSVTFELEDPIPYLQAFAKICECSDIYPGEGNTLTLTKESMATVSPFLRAFLQSIEKRKKESQEGVSVRINGSNMYVCIRQSGLMGGAKVSKNLTFSMRAMHEGVNCLCGKKSSR